MWSTSGDFDWLFELLDVGEVVSVFITFAVLRLFQVSWITCLFKLELRWVLFVTLWTDKRNSAWKAISIASTFRFYAQYWRILSEMDASKSLMNPSLRFFVRLEMDRRDSVWNAMLFKSAYGFFIQLWRKLLWIDTLTPSIKTSFRVAFSQTSVPLHDLATRSSAYSGVVILAGCI